MEALLTADELATYIGLSVQTIYNRHSNGGALPRCVIIGRRLRFYPRDVERWLEQMAAHQERPKLAEVQPAVPAKRGRPTKAEQMARRQARFG